MTQGHNYDPELYKALARLHGQVVGYIYPKLSEVDKAYILPYLTQAEDTLIQIRGPEGSGNRVWLQWTEVSDA